jgi:dihydrofolate reductase
MLNMIVAVDKNMGIGKDNKLLAYIKPDLEYFKKVTLNNTIVMGYNTYLSLPIRPLPNRKNVVLTSKDIELEGATVVHSVEEVLELAKTENVFICGGESVYRQFMSYADTLYVTHISYAYEADTYFPAIGEEWVVESKIAGDDNINHQYPHSFWVYRRKE